MWILKSWPSWVPPSKRGFDQKEGRNKGVISHHCPLLRPVNLWDNPIDRSSIFGGKAHPFRGITWDNLNDEDALWNLWKRLISLGTHHFSSLFQVISFKTWIQVQGVQDPDDLRLWVLCDFPWSSLRNPTKFSVGGWDPHILLMVVVFVPYSFLGVMQSMGTPFHPLAVSYI